MFAISSGQEKTQFQGYSFSLPGLNPGRDPLNKQTNKSHFKKKEFMCFTDNGEAVTIARKQLKTWGKHW